MLSSRIGPAPGLSLLPVSQGGHPPINRGRPADVVAATLPPSRANITGISSQPYNSLPTSSHARHPSEEGTAYGVARFASNGLADEFGATRPPIAVPPPTSLVVPPPAVSSPITSTNSSTARRPNSAGGGHRFTVTNLQPQDLPQSITPSPSRQRSANGTGSGPSSGNAPRQWPTAEEEKMRLYEKARAQVAKVQGPGATPVCFTNIL